MWLQDLSLAREAGLTWEAFPRHEIYMVAVGVPEDMTAPAS